MYVCTRQFLIPVPRSSPEASCYFNRRLVIRALGIGQVGSTGQCWEGGREKRSGFRPFPPLIFPHAPSQLAILVNYSSWVASAEERVFTSSQSIQESVVSFISYGLLNHSGHLLFTSIFIFNRQIAIEGKSDGYTSL